MSEMNSDPIRLQDDPASGPVLRGDLGAATNVRLTGLDVAAGLTGLQVALAAEAAGGAVPVAASGMSLAAKAALAGVLLVGGVAAWVGLSRGEHPSVPTASASLATSPAVPTPPRGAGTVVSSPLAVPADPVSGEAPVLPRAQASVEPTVEPTVQAAVDPDTRPASSTGRRKAPPLSAEDAMAEASLIARATKLLSTAPGDALALTDEAKREFPRGMLVEEREAIAIQALAKLGKGEAAARRGEAFMTRYSRGPHAAAVRAVLAPAP